MTIARHEQIDTSVARWYRCITRCVRQAFLLAEGTFDRKEWIDDRLEEPAQVFAVGVGGFSVMGNHPHVLPRLDPDVAEGWSDEFDGLSVGSYLLLTERATSGQPRVISGSVTRS
jgi:hypothetical protein